MILQLRQMQSRCITSSEGYGDISTGTSEQLPLEI